MDDKLIVDMFFARDERALSQVEKKYGKLLYNVANNILSSCEDSEECVIDTYKSAWETIPPKRPLCLGAYLSKITKNHAINRYNFNKAEKRNENLKIALCEIESFLPSPDFAQDTTVALVFKSAINSFLRALPEKKRNIFILRYWYLFEVKDISQKTGIGQEAIKLILMRLRQKLKKHLEREGIIV